MTQRQVLPAVIPGKGAIVACLAFATSACGGTTDLWQGEEVLVEARQVTLERNVEGVSENHRELKDRFNALERLYVDLVRHVQNQDQVLNSLEKKLANFEKDPETEAALRRVRNDLSGMRKDMKSMENRIFTVEMTDRNIQFQNTQAPAKDTSQPAPSNTSQGTSQPQQQPQAQNAVANQAATAPTGTAQTGADVRTGSIGTPATNQTPVDDRTYYGAHLASYRSREQVGSGWAALYRAFSDQLDGLTPKIYVQNQQGIGTFLRLIVGPLERQEDAQLLCENIRAVGGEQYCRVSEYQGEAIE